MSTEPLHGIGSTIGAYRVDALLGRGGMGVVYRAEDTRLGRRVALKLLQASLADDPRYRERFLRESRLAASIEHSGIVPIYDAGEADGLLYIAMRYVDGVDLGTLVRREGPLEPQRAVALVGDLAGALDAAHARGLVHRDVKPSNALIGRDSDGEHAYLVDFGITQELAEKQRLTATDQLIGTLDYLAPERIRGEPYDGRSDIYALGCVLFECLTGQPPFPGSSQAAMIYGHLEQQPRRPSELRPGLPRALDAVVAKALAKDPADRWQSGAELRAAARDAVAGIRPAREGPRRRVVLAAALAVLVVGIAVALLLRGDGGLDGLAENTAGLIDPGSGEITAQYPVGKEPSAIAGGAGSVWVANRSDGTVTRIDRKAGQLVTIDVGGRPSGLAFGAGSIWVADDVGRTVAQIAPATNRVIERHRVGNAAHAVAVGHGAVWVASAVDATLSRIDLADGDTRTIAVDARPSAVATGAGAVWVVSEATGRLLRLDPRTGTPLGSVPVGSGASAIAVGRGAVWVANRRAGTISRIDPASEIAETRRVGREPRALAADGDGVWVGLAGEGRIARLDEDDLDEGRAVDVGSSPAALAVVGGDVWTASVAGAAAHRGGRLRVSLVSPEPVFADPIAIGTLLPLLWDGLTTYRRAGGSAGGTLVQALAASLPEPSADRLTYVFRLRRGLRFSDGSPVRPTDVRASIERLLALSREPDVPGIRGGDACTRRRCDLSQSIETDDATGIVTMHLARPDPDFLHKLQAAFITPAGTPRKVAESTIPPGTGPYRVKRWDARKGGLLVRNPHFRAWSTDRPDGFPDEIEFRVEAEGRQVADIERGRIDVAELSLDESAGSLRARLGSRLHIDPGAVTAYVFLNTRKPPFDDVRVRRALNYAVDRGRAVDLLGGPNAGAVTCQMLPPGFQGHAPGCAYTANPNAAGTWTGPDVARARRLIAASGTRGTEVELLTAEPFIGVGRYFTRLLRRLGYRSSMRTLDDLFLVSQQREAPQIGGWGWMAASASPYSFLEPLLSCSAELNLSRFCDRELDALMLRAAESRGPEAVDLWRQVQARLTEQAPTVPLQNRQYATMLSERVGNYQHHPLYGPLLEQLWVR